jgi:hypothetical protein
MPNHDVARIGIAQQRPRPLFQQVPRQVVVAQVGHPDFELPPLLIEIGGLHLAIGQLGGPRPGREQAQLPGQGLGGQIDHGQEQASGQAIGGHPLKQLGRSF